MIVVGDLLPCDFTGWWCLLGFLVVLVFLGGKVPRAADSLQLFPSVLILRSFDEQQCIAYHSELAGC